MEQLDKTTLGKIIVMIDAEVKNLENDENIWQEEEHFGIKHLKNLQDELWKLYWVDEPTS
jgi:hypothetical protein